MYKNIWNLIFFSDFTSKETNEGLNYLGLNSNECSSTAILSKESRPGSVRAENNNKKNEEIHELPYSNEMLLLRNDFEGENCDLASFLIERASQNTTLANYFYW